MKEVEEELTEMHDAVSEYMSSVRRMQEASIRVHEVFAMLLREESEVPVQVLNAVKASRANKDWCSQQSEYAMLETVIRPAGERLKLFAALKAKENQRQQKLLDYDAYRSRLNAESTKNPDSEHVFKLQSKLDRARESVDLVTDEVVTKCVDIEHGEREMVEKAFSCFIACEAAVGERQCQSMNPLLLDLPKAAEAIVLINSRAV